MVNECTAAKRAFIEATAQKICVKTCQEGRRTDSSAVRLRAEEAVAQAEKLWEVINQRHPVPVPAPAPAPPQTVPATTAKTGPHEVSRGAWFLPESVSGLS